ncbi:hypothetical protein [Acidocella aminolytica]|jgi:hypothetical protein|uniref:Uncharacterized protein n=1 Tax=Acidocella aminolytica 101 = DSM 11237 TaxID=1120923 RepID=A0A0D6PKB4_9PROT|nr:hypothetical protein [Acidocella aminolytica]GAN81886.1 hypothetical protein Aam_126_015 [Acidocella aminolytica 101 = DSM 11237]GBQ42578.1 hypothetical protein AA11237_3005 [Acidocella aminolytica 101 = DSM 11237]SHF20506.1 hypothetical protein SAMN02746095_02442 [Acidocella aminolytica 101 = DSM 11237]
MSTIVHWKGQDLAGVALAALVGGGAFVFRELAIVPRATVGICAASAAPGWCVPRSWVLQWQYLGLFGWVALAAGLAAFFSGSRILAGLAVGLGIAAVVNYNGTEGVVGAALGLVAWLSLLTGRPGWVSKP